MKLFMSSFGRTTERGHDLRLGFADLYLKRLVRNPRGRAFLLNMMIDGEEADEQGVFDTLHARVDDADLQKMIRIHRDDEFRHADMLRQRLAKVGVEPVRVPPSLRLVPRIDRHAGGSVGAFLETRAGVMETYLLLQVIEERATRQFPKVAEAMRGVDPETASVIDRIVRDEERHVKYAKAISRKYAPDAGTRERTLSRLRRAEAMAFAEHSREFLRFGIEQGLLVVSGPERLFWRFLASLSNLAVGTERSRSNPARA